MLPREFGITGDGVGKTLLEVLQRYQAVLIGVDILQVQGNHSRRIVSGQWSCCGELLAGGVYEFETYITFAVFVLPFFDN